MTIFQNSVRRLLHNHLAKKMNQTVEEMNHLGESYSGFTDLPVGANKSFIEFVGDCHDLFQMFF